MMVDTLTIARELKAADLPDGQAEAIAAAIGRSVTETAATKGDLELVKQELRSDIAGVRTDMGGLRADVERVRNQLILWFTSTQIAFAGLVIALIKL